MKKAEQAKILRNIINDLETQLALYVADQRRLGEAAHTSSFERPNMLTENEQAMRARCDAATKGPLVGHHSRTVKDLGVQSVVDSVRESIEKSIAHDGGHSWCWIETEGDDSVIVALFGCGPTSEANMRFYGNARQDLPACLDTIEKLRGVLAEAREMAHGVELAIRQGVPSEAVGLSRAFLAKHKERNDGNK